MLYTANITKWQQRAATPLQQEVIDSLEAGKVIFLPQLSFEILPEETVFLATGHADPKTKNISFDHKKSALQGAICLSGEQQALLQLMLRYAQQAKFLIAQLLPNYVNHIEQGRTSFRPVEIAGRKAPSYRKDDTLLHVDAFPSTPTRGKRILRIFSNVNPDNAPRVWRLGAKFPDVVEYFLPKLSKPVPGSFYLLNLVKATREVRTKYDHYMLQLHNSMKADLTYQQEVHQLEFSFPAGSSWIVYTDQVSHAAMSGQYVFEQTFYVPPIALKHIEKSPCKVLEHYIGSSLL